MPPVALITGITGQDGAYLAEFLLSRGYEVHGMVRRASTENFERIGHLTSEITLHQADLLDQLSIITLVRDIRPREIYNLAAQSFVPTSWLQPLLTGEFTALGVTRMLEAVRLGRSEDTFLPGQFERDVRRCARGAADREDSLLAPKSVRRGQGLWPLDYGQLRESYDIFACSGILFNHESPPRGKEFVTRKVTDSVARIKLGVQNKLCLGNLEAMATGDSPATMSGRCG